MTDITDLINEASQELTHEDPLICASSFNLFDSMSALDLMDPKMDGCEIPKSYYQRQGREGDNNSENSGKKAPSSKSSCQKEDKEEVETQTETVPPRPVPRSLHDQIYPLPWDNLTMRQARVIVLETLTRFQSFLDGNSVAETIYTCLYAHNAILSDMQSKVINTNLVSGSNSKPGFNHHLREVGKAQLAVWGVSLLMVKLSKLVKQIIQKADIYEEEDFTMTTSNFNFFPSLSDEDLMKWIAHIRNALRGNVDGDVVNADGDNESGADVHTPDENETSIVHVIEFMTGFYNSCTTLFNMTKENVEQSIKSAMEEIAKGVEMIHHLIEFVQSSTGELTQDDRDVISDSFDPYVNRHALGNAPVKKIAFPSQREALQSLIVIYGQISSGPCTLFSRGDTFSRIQRILTRMSASKTPLNILSRSLIVTCLYFDDLLFGRFPLPIIIARHMHRCGVPESVTQTQYGMEFLNRLCKPVYDLFKLLTLNRSRQRTFMDALMFRDWADLQRDAALVDVSFKEEFQLTGNHPTLFVTNYILSITVGLMEHHVGLGIELGLFNGHYHLSTAYWYRDFLLSTNLNIVTTLKAQLQQRKAMQAKIAREEAASAKSKSDKGKKKGKRGRKANKIEKNAFPSPEITKEDREDNLDIILMTVERTMCRGILMFIAALNQAGLLKRPEYKFTSHELCFNKRFESFQAIKQPAPLTYGDFVQGTDFTSVAPANLISSSTECFKTCRNLLEKAIADGTLVDANYCCVSKEDAMSLVKICIGNSLFLHKFVQQHGDSGNSCDQKVTFDFSTAQFCTVKIT